MGLKYFWAKFFKKLGSSAIRQSNIDKTSKIEANSLVINSNFGKHSFCGYYNEIINVEIGSFCSIANHVIIGGGMHPIEWVSTSPVFYSGRDSVKAKFSEFERSPLKRTTIGHDVWIGECAIIKQGITIGTGAVIGMGSVVTKNVEPYAIVAGNPAKLIRKRFDDVVIKNLLETCWWELPEDRLSHLAKFIKDPIVFLQKIKQ